MKEKILQLLKDSQEYISGEEISNILGVSRTAIWKHINALKGEGYLIESQTKLGYRLIKTPDRLYPAEISGYLKTKWLGHNLVYNETIDSTNRIARELAEAGGDAGTVVLAEQQTAGRGRLGRQWHSPFGTGIWMSLILKPQISPEDAPKITLVTAVAVAQAFKELTDLQPGIKWPNDILFQGKKACGVLTELKADMDCIHYVIAGIGINVNDEIFPEEIQQIATSLRIESGSILERTKIVGAILNNIEHYYELWQQEGFESIRDTWKKYSINLNREVTINTLKDIIHGVAVDIDEDGLLLVKDAQGLIQRITAGDVSLRR